MKYKTYDRYCVKIVIECAEFAGIGSRFHQPIDTHDGNLFFVLHIIFQEAVTLIKIFPALHLCDI
jgi:hypothetical protein